MEGLEFLNRGDIKMIAHKLGFTQEYVSMVIHGKKNNNKIDISYEKKCCEGMMARIR